MTPTPRPRLRARTALGGLALVAAVAGCGPREPAPVHPMIVVGIDGGEWSVIERLWADGELPALRALAERGARAHLATDYGLSPVIWTTIATGRRPREHGITDFVTPTERGDVPVSSDHRRVPALWNMASAAGKRVAVLGWWGSWPAEEVDGLVVTDRPFRESVRRAYPASLEADLDRPAGGGDGGWDLSLLHQRRDRLMARLGRELAPEGFDLTMVYLHSVDFASHNFWRYWEPDRFGPPDPAESPVELTALAERIPDVYRATDRAIGEIVAAAPAATNVLVVSDHGFHAMEEPRVRLRFDLDAVFERFGFLSRDTGGGVDVAASRLYTYGTPPYRGEKLVRFGDAVPPAERAALRDRLERHLARVTWAGGEPALEARDAETGERRRGADLVVVVRHQGATRELLVDRRPFDDPATGDRPSGGPPSGSPRVRKPVRFLNRVSGGHQADTAGILIAAGPDVEPGAAVGGISIKDLAPTILYGIGLPTAEDFVGRAFTELYTAEFRRDHPPLTIESWGTREPGETARSEADRELIEELRALGYLQ